MRFIQNLNPGFLQCYSMERPYTDPEQKYHSYKEGIFVPPTLAGLAQIVAYFTDPETCPKIPWTRAPFLHEENEIHLWARQLCEDGGIIGNPQKWDAYIDTQIKKLKGVSDLAFTQLNASADVLKHAAFIEDNANTNGLVPLWRFSQAGHDKDIEYLHAPAVETHTTKKHLNFGDSILGGYVRDGMNYSDLVLGIGNYSACVLNYYDIHCQAVQASKVGYIKSIDYTISPKKNNSCPFLNYRIIMFNILAHYKNMRYMHLSLI